MANDEINVPSLVLILVVSGFLIRHFFFRGTSSAESTSSDARGTSQQGQSRDQRRAEALNRRIEAAVEQIQQIFPYADRREVWWDLRRNGLNVAATTDRILAGRLDTPPITFQPPPGPARQSSASTSARSGTAAVSGAAAAASKPGQPSLIQRYHLENKIAKAADETRDAESTSSSASTPTSGAKAKNWSSNRDERQALLKKRRDDMILEARRKMEAKIAAEKAAAATASVSNS